MIPTILQWFALAGGIVTALGAVIGVTTVIVTMRQKVTELGDRRQEQQKKSDELDAQVVAMLTTLKEFMGAQAAVNVNVAEQLRQQVETNEKVADVLSDVIGRLKGVEHATVDSSQIVSLLTEVLKKQKVIAQE